MSHVRALQRDDIPAVAQLALETTEVSQRLLEYYERTLFDDPWCDPELPSLVYEDDGGAILAFQGSVTRRAVFDKQPIRIACGVTVVSRPDVRSRGLGALLVRSYLAGAQDLTITDAATEQMRAIWLRLGGTAVSQNCIGWVRVFRPAAFAAERFGAGRMWAMLDGGITRIARSLVPAPPATTSLDLAPQALAEWLRTLGESVRLHVAYDEQFLTRLLEELGALPTYGAPVVRVVRDRRGRTVGSYVYYLKPRGISHVLQVAAAETHAGEVLDDLFRHAWTNGATAVRGRVEAHLLAALGSRQCLFRYVGGALMHSRHPELRATVAEGDALLTRLDGEWWMGHFAPELRESA
jgi:GNAT superfamily N-acetyltransferase